MHELELRYASLHVAEPGRSARLLSSLARHGQRSPVLVIREDQRYVLIDGYTRVQALGELGRDVVEAIVLDLAEPAALILAHRLESRRRRSALEDGWLIAALIERHGVSQREVATQLQRSHSWVSRRLALVRALPERAQAAVRDGLLPAHAAARYLVPLARANASHCERLVVGLGQQAVTDRQLERLYLGWRRAESEQARERLLDHPWLFLKAEAALAPEPAVPAEDPAAPLIDDLDGVTGLARRARRRVRAGLLDELDASRRDLVGRAAKEARLVFDSLLDLLSEPPSCSTSTPARPS